MASYDHKALQAKWKECWFKDNIYRAEDFSPKPKKYILVEFPYPSGDGLHMGHVWRYTFCEVYSRRLRMAGYNVMLPMGWDAFGLPAETYAIKTGVHPSIRTAQSIKNFKDVLLDMGFGFDWSREVDTTDPKYFKWTQWIFLKFFEQGLAELREEPIWWCEALKTVLANEEVLEDESGNKISERGNHPVVKKPLRQWVLKITEYADKLLKGLDTIDFQEHVKTAQRNWIGRSEGARVKFPLSVDKDSFLEVFTTRPDTIFGVTFMALAPEHGLLEKYKKHITNWTEVEKYLTQAKNRSSIDRQAAKDKTGIKLEGIHAINPLNPSGTPLPIYVADYILIEYGTGSIMGVPGHDDRDFEFASKYQLPIIQTVLNPKNQDEKLPFVSEDGVIKVDAGLKLIFSSDELKKPIDCAAMKRRVIDSLQQKDLGKGEVAYRIKDWLFSRQRFWGEPIPLLHTVDGKVEAIVNTADSKAVQAKLPLMLPEVPNYEPSSDGTSPLARNESWVNVTDSKGRPAKRETNTMPNWAGSCWYYLRYIDPKNDQAFADPEKLKYWLPVDRYFGGSEHTTLHLLYSRFWHVFLYDLGLVPTPEPYASRLNGGIILGSDGTKMSKSVGNVINPLELQEKYGADALRTYLCFMGPIDSTMPWNENGLKACRKFIESVYDLRAKVAPGKVEDAKILKMYHKMVKRVGEMVDNLKLNTAVSEFMIFVNEAKKAAAIDRDVWKGFLKVMAPFAVFCCEDLWHEINGYTDWKPENSVHLQAWPQFDPELVKDETVTLGIQVNGKVRGEIEVKVDEARESVESRVMAMPEIMKWFEGKTVKKFVYVPARIVSLVVSE